MNNLFSTVHKIINVSQPECSITYNLPLISNPIIPSVPTVESTTKEDLVDEMLKIEEELEEIKLVVEQIIESISLDDMPDTDDPMTTGGCLVATAVCGTELSQQVQLLREIRDVTLMNTVPGSTFMISFNQIYYTFLPIVANAERENPLLRNTLQIFLSPLLSSISLLNLSDDSTENIFTIGLAIIVLNLLMYIVLPIFITFRFEKIMNMITNL